MVSIKSAKLSSLAFGLLCISNVSFGQIGFDPSIDFNVIPDEVVVPASPIQKQVIFIGGHDVVQTTETYGNPAGEYPAKQWHDFIGFTPDLTPGTPDLGWITINHEMVTSDPNIGDGGGMTVFKIRRNADTDSIEVVEQTLADGRTGLYFNVDFANTVGETGMNCGGITSEYDGRIWSAEEWFRSDNASIYADGLGVLDTLDFTISGSGIPMADGKTIKKYENFNWMVEVDPKEAVAIRKQYNWGRQPFEGGVVMPDNKTVYTGADNTPGILSKFIADTEGDFTSGKLYAYREDDKQMRLSHQASFENAFSEISAYDEVNNRIYSTNSEDNGILVTEFVNASSIDSVGFVDLSLYGKPTSVAVHNGIVAVSIPDAIAQNAGQVIFFDNSFTILNTITVGALPDMVTYTPNGDFLLVANEGEPNDDYTIDPDGTVSVIDLTSGVASATVQTADFNAFTTALIPDVRVFGNNTTDVSADLEPEYIAVNGASTKAYVALQENNAIAVLDIATATIEDVISLGYKDYSLSENHIDASDDDGIIGNFQQWDNVYGMYQPDAISIVEIGGVEYILTANEGDARDYNGYSEEERVADVILDPTVFPNPATLQLDENLGRLKITTSQGDIDNDGDFDVLYSYGARSFSIWDLNGNQVFDSGNEIGKILAERFGDNYADNRDDDKGSEPESITFGHVGGKTFAYIGLERAAGVMVYDISDPANSKFVNYFNENGTDQSPEGLVFVDAVNSPTGLPYLISTNESFSGYNGSISAYNVNGFDGKKWIEIDNSRMDKMLDYQAEAINAGATMFNRLEWVAFNSDDNNIYITETGRDNPASRWRGHMYNGGVVANHHIERANTQGTDPFASDYVDYYGRILKLDVANDSIMSTLEAGPEFHDTPNVTMGSYPDVHLSNPDGLTFMNVNGNPYMVICEDLNGTSHGRMPAGVSNRACELFILDMTIANPSIDDLVRIAQVPFGAEVTGVRATPDGKTLFFNSQHPNSSNPFPYNNSLTIALTGWDYLNQAGIDELSEDNSAFSVYPNPTSRIVYFNEVMDVALYDFNGKLIRVQRNASQLDIMDLNPGVYYIQNSAGQRKRLVIQ
ncbi:MAG: choice-of-anchor I family protein [Crocinitomicaceae bacterium]|nr:choice-of-anchor I family protein [Crocinitomicaceae bacterium]